MELGLRLARLAPITSIALGLLAVACGGDPSPLDPVDPGDPGDTGQPASIALRLGSSALTQYDFGSLAVGDASPALALTLVNDTTAPTGALDLRLVGGDGRDFAVDELDDDCDGGVVLAPGAACSLRVRFRPSQVGTRATTLIAASSPGGSTVLTLSGVGAPASPGPDAGVPDPSQPDPCASGTTISGDVRIRTSADLPALAGVGTITGDLIVDAPAITTLSLPDLRRVGRDLGVQATSGKLAALRLPGLCAIGRGLQIRAGALASADLAALATVGGDVDLAQLPLVALGTSAALRRIGGVLRITDAPALASLAGSDGLTALGGLELIRVPLVTTLAPLSVPAALTSLRLESDAALTDLSGLGHLAAVTGTLAINGDPALTRLAGLDGLITAGGLELKENPALADASALGRVELLGSLDVVNDDALTALALPTLAAIDRALNVVGNDALGTLALDGLVALGQNSTIYDNPALPGCRADRVRNQVTMRGFTGSFGTGGNGLCGVGPTWLRGAGGSATATHRGIAAFPDGSFVVGVDLTGARNTGFVFGSGEPGETTFTIDAANPLRHMVARYRADGTLDWVDTLSASSTAVVDVLAAPGGAVKMQFADGTLITRTEDGDHEYSWTGGTTSAVAGTPDGGVIVAARNDCSGCPNARISAYDAAGNPVWTHLLVVSSTSITAPSGVARLADGTILVSGSWQGTALFGSSSPNARSITATSTMGYLARYAATGAFLGVETVDGFAPVIVGAGAYAALCGVASAATLTDGDRPAKTATGVVIARYASDGHIGWLRTARAVNGAVSACSITGGEQGVAVALTAGWAVVAFEPGTLRETRLGYEADPIVARFTADGTFTGGIVLDRSTNDGSDPVALAMAPDGPIVYGRTGATLKVGPLTLPLPLNATRALFFARLTGRAEHP